MIKAEEIKLNIEVRLQCANCPIKYDLLKASVLSGLGNLITCPQCKSSEILLGLKESGEPVIIDLYDSGIYNINCLNRLNNISSQLLDLVNIKEINNTASIASPGSTFTWSNSIASEPALTRRSYGEALNSITANIYDAPSLRDFILSPLGNELDPSPEDGIMPNLRSELNEAIASNSSTNLRANDYIIQQSPTISSRLRSSDDVF